MNIYDLSQENDYISLKLFFWLLSNHNFWPFKKNTSHFEIDAWNFLYFNFLRVSLYLLGHHTIQYKSLSLFPSQILVCATTFVAYYFFSRFDICWVIKKKHKGMGRYIGPSLCMYQHHQDYCLIIHDKLENRFTTITHRC